MNRARSPLPRIFPTLTMMMLIPITLILSATGKAQIPVKPNLPSAEKLICPRSKVEIYSRSPIHQLTEKAGVIVPFFGNRACPMSGDPVLPHTFATHGSLKIYFCCQSCASKGQSRASTWAKRAYPDQESRESFEKNPILALTRARYPRAKPPTNLLCPVSNRPIEQGILAIFMGQIYAFENWPSVSLFAGNPEKYVPVQQKKDSSLYLIHDINVIPVSSPGIIPSQDVTIRNGVITSIRPSDQTALPEDHKIIEGKDRYLLPGLMDMHVHLPRRSDENPYSIDEFLSLHLAAGVTLVRSMRGHPDDIELRDSLERDERIGPHIIAGSPAIDGKSAPNPAKARALVQNYKEAGFDLLKLTEGFSTETFLALAEEAARANIPLAGHVPDEISLDQALDAPFKTIEHLHGHGAAHADPLVDFEELARRTTQAGVWICPTLSFQVGWYGQESVDTMMNWPGMEFAHPATKARWKEEAEERQNLSPEALLENSSRMKHRLEAVLALARARVGLLASPSTGYFLVPGFGLHVELEWLLRAGLKPSQILQAATLDAARCVGEESRFGSVEKNKVANLVLLASNPLEDIRHTRTVDGVFVRGHYISKKGLAKRLSGLRTRLAQEARSSTR